MLRTLANDFWEFHPANKKQDNIQLIGKAKLLRSSQRASGSIILELSAEKN
jgi:hypothetical protein